MTPLSSPEERRAPRVAFATLGCKVNQYDTQAMIEVFQRHGYELVDFPEMADVYVINTCTVTGRADQKSRQLLRRARRQNPLAVTVVAGCLPQANPQAAAGLAEADVVIGHRERKTLVEVVEEARRRRQTGSAPGPLVRVAPWEPGVVFDETPITAMTGRTRATIKIQEGCNLHCTYCIIPYARGPARSRDPAAVVAEVRRLAAAGYREFVFTGICMGGYGRDLTPPVSLARLVREVAAVPGVARIRLSSVEPTDIDEELLQAVAQPPAAAHLHIPLQSGSDPILVRMGRRYTREEYAAVVARARAIIPDLAVTTDVMVGFPGETEEDFLATRDFVEAMGFARIHVFPYSRRPGTPAAEMPGQLGEDVKEARVRMLVALGARLGQKFQERFLGRVMAVLVEEHRDGQGRLEGLTGNYLRVAFEGDDRFKGELVPVRLLRPDEGVLAGEIVTGG